MALIKKKVTTNESMRGQAENYLKAWTLGGYNSVTRGQRILKFCI